MAYTKNTKNNTKSVKETAEEIKVEPKTFAPTDDISCVSVTAGELILIGKKTGNLYRWSNYGDSTMVEFQDLRAETRNANSKYIYSPLMMIEDEEVLALPEFANVADSYKNAITIEEIDSFFDLPVQQFASTLKRLPNGIKNTIKSIAADRLESGNLDSLSKIKVLDEVLGTELYNLLVNG